MCARPFPLFSVPHSASSYNVCAAMVQGLQNYIIVLRETITSSSASRKDKVLYTCIDAARLGSCVLSPPSLPPLRSPSGLFR